MDRLTLITSNTTIYDVNGYGLPPGNYFFLKKSMNSESIKGIVKSERMSDFNAIYEFKLSDYVSMISKANIRLSVLTNINIPSINDFEEISEEESSEPETCSICLTQLSQNREILSCAHHFHHNCISRWLIQNSSCPICRHPVNNSIIHNDRIINNNRNDDNLIQDDNLINIISRRRRQPPSRRRTSRTRNTIIVPRPPRRSERVSSRQREYIQMFSSSNINDIFS